MLLKPKDYKIKDKYKKEYSNFMWEEYGILVKNKKKISK